MSDIEKLAWNIAKFLNKNDCATDTRIYFEGKCIRNGKDVVENINPLDYFEYANPDTISMSFEGKFNHAMNYGVPTWNIQRKFSELVKKYGYYYEFGYAWTLSLYKTPSKEDALC